MRRGIICATILGLAATLSPGPMSVTVSATEHASDRPNIVVFLADDLGYADTAVYGGKIATPHIDALARAGMRFTDAHTTSSVCTPTRYGFLTGRYNWRSRLKSGVLGGLSPRLIEPGRMTIASLLQARGYHTACVGKWHLGMDWHIKPGRQIDPMGIESRDQVFNVDYDRPITGGPNSVGFDHFFGISASLDMVPYTFIENDRVTASPTEDRDFLMMHGRPQGGKTRQGPTAPDFDAADVLPMITRKSVAYIDERAQAATNGDRRIPFFLYVPFASPHTPILPTPQWQGKSGINPYADFVMQTDAAVGEILDALQRNSLAENTLVIFTSDNGCSPQAMFDELAEKGHHPSGPLRGHNADTVTGKLACLTDVMATVAELTGEPLPDDAGEDSISLLAVLRGDTDAAKTRDHLVSHSINGSFAIRRGDWKLLLCPDSGGWSDPKPGSAEAAALPPTQLYNLADDLGERTNRVATEPQIAAELSELLDKLISSSRSD